MEKGIRRPNKFIRIRVFVVTLGIAINLALYFVMLFFGMPLYLDTTGTILSALVAGPFFGILTAVVTNTVSLIAYPDAIYFSSINAIIAIVTANYARKHSLKNIRSVARFILILAVLSGVLSTLIRMVLSSGTSANLVESTAQDFSTVTGFPYIVAVLVLDILLNLFDKGISVGIAFLIVMVIPEGVFEGIETSILKQSHLTENEKSNLKEKAKEVRYSVRARETFTLILTSTVLIVSMVLAGLNMYFKTEKRSKTENAVCAAKFAAEVIDATKLETYLREGKEADGYRETSEMLSGILSTARGVEELYIVTVHEEGFCYIFDICTDRKKQRVVGERGDFSEGILPYVNTMINGAEVDPIEHDGLTGWVLSAYYPVSDRNGRTVCYAGCDVSLDYMADYMIEYGIRLFLILAGVYILILAYELWITSIYTTYPISAMTACVEQFSEAGDDQKSLDENVHNIRALDIHTGDEIEKLYNSICQMTLNQAEQMRNIRHLSESTLKMQDGLIITMADMVESRDSDTGAHVQKTAAYVRIIAEGLRKKGYYAEKVTPKFISDCVRSAPLHDVGKINIPDEILNKPGKLTPEEFEIMKTHTTAGKIIIEKAINTVKGGSYLKEARNMAAYHHERWDGKGYPEGLHGEVIPLSARIMAVADVFDALASPRVYKPAFPLEKALQIIQEGAGTQFDAKCVEVFMEALPEVKIILKKYDNF